MTVSREYMLLLRFDPLSIIYLPDTWLSIEMFSTGVVAWSMASGVENTLCLLELDVYTDVDYYRGWITGKTDVSGFSVTWR